MRSAEYSGDLSATEAWEMLSRDNAVTLVDVRTQPEWQFVGVPDLGRLGRQPLFVSWQTWPGMRPNEAFVDALRDAGANANQPLLFLCRSGVRSRAAAVATTAAGFGPCFNVAGGFEGNHDASRHRGTVDGWKAKGLPWTQE